MSSEALRVIQMIPDLRVGGAERVAVTLANGLAERGHKVMLLAIKGGGAQEMHVREDLGVELRILGIQRDSIKRPLRFVKSMNKLRGSICDVLEEFKPDVINTHIPEDDLLASDCVQRTGIGVHVPLVQSLMFHIHRQGLDFRTRMRLKMMRKMFYRSGLTLAVSSGVAKQITALTGLPEDRMEVLHNVTDIRPYADLPKKAEARLSLGLDVDRPVVAGLGRLHPAKNFPMFVRASKAILKKHPNVQFMIIGEGDQRGKIEAAMKEADVGASWTLLGQRNDVPQCLAAADIFVQSSDYEGFPVAVVEAMAGGLQIVATDVASLGEVVQDGTHALLIKAGAQDDLSARVIELLENPEKGQALAAAAKDLAWSYYNIDAYIKRAEGFLRGAIANKND
ncbi:MAG: glycosyltransferase [Planctomycetes bacterium]|nr:glycosyltransferase [Planctomycetota bacterium]